MTPGKVYDWLKLKNFARKNVEIYYFRKYTNLNRKIRESLDWKESAFKS